MLSRSPSTKDMTLSMCKYRACYSVNLTGRRCKANFSAVRSVVK